MGYEITPDGKVVGTEELPVKATFYEQMVQVGKSQYKPMDYITIRRIGVKDYVSRKATDDDRAAFPREWADYQAGLVAEENGATPLENLPACRPAFVLELKQLDITTVEELAAQPEAPFDYIEGMYKQARKYVQLMEPDNAGEQPKESPAREAGVDHLETRFEHRGNAQAYGSGQAGLSGVIQTYSQNIQGV